MGSKVSLVSLLSLPLLDWKEGSSLPAYFHGKGGLFFRFFLLLATVQIFEESLDLT